MKMLINLMRCGSGVISYRHDDKIQSFLYSFSALGTDKSDIPGSGIFLYLDSLDSLDLLL